MVMCVSEWVEMIGKSRKWMGVVSNSSRWVKVVGRKGEKPVGVSGKMQDGAGVCCFLHEDPQSV